MTGERNDAVRSCPPGPGGLVAMRAGGLLAVAVLAASLAASLAVSDPVGAGDAADATSSASPAEARLAGHSPASEGGAEGAGGAGGDAVYVDLADRLVDLDIVRDDDGRIYIEIATDRGVRRLTPEQFVSVVDREQEAMRARGFVFRFLNITTWWGVLWVSIGLLGQLLFTLRMILQWVASEKEHRSVVPVGFWWGSLLGGVMLLVYFIWRKDIVGILGQSTGAIIYIRNLWLIYFTSATPRLHASPAIKPTTNRL